jgi:hypothetical protein
MEAGFFVMDEVPFAPGESPYQCKGVMYNDLFLYFDEQVRGGRTAVFDRLMHSRLRPFFLQKFVNVGWYDVFPLVSLQRTAAVVVNTTYLELVRGFAKWTFPRQVHGIYKFLLKLTTPDMMARGFPRAGSQFYNFLRVDVQQVRPKMYQSRCSNIPEMLAPSYMASTESAVVTLLELSGAKGVRHRWLPPTDDGEAHGVKLLSVTREISWD